MIEPKLRFKADDGSQFPEWEKKYLSDIASFHSGLTYTPDDVVDSENGILVFRSSNIQNGRIAYDDNVYVDKELKEKNYVKLHDIVVCVRNGSKSLVGKNALVTESDLNATWGAFMTVIRAKQNYEFVHQYLNSTFFKKEMYKDSGTATINQITTAMLNGCKLFVPSLAEQQKIAEFLSTIDTVIEKQKETVSVWEERKKGVMQKLFNQEVRFKADDGSEFPEWEKKKLEDVVEFLDGQRKPLEAGQRVSGKYPYYGASGIIDYVEDYIFDEELILLSEDGANILDRNYRVCFLAKGKYWVNNHAHVLRAMDGNVNGFICEQLESFDYRKYNSGGAQPKLNQATCRSIIMNIPCFAEQQKIADCLSSLDEVIEKQKATLAAWEELKKGLLQQMFV